jgi:hypothetical protein
MYFNYLSPSDQVLWNAIPRRTRDAISEFAAVYEAWYDSSYGFFATAVRKLNAGDSTWMREFVFISSLFANSATGKITTYCENNSLCSPLGVSQDNFTWNQTSVSFGIYKFPLNDNNEVVGVQEGTSPLIAVKPPIALAPSAVIRFSLSEMVQTSDPNQKIQILEPIDLTYRFLPHEKDQVRAILQQLPVNQLQGLQLVQARPLNSKPSSLPADQICSYSAAATITCYLDTLPRRQSASLDMNAQLTRVIGNNVYDKLLTDGSRREWGSL